MPARGSRCDHQQEGSASPHRPAWWPDANPCASASSGSVVLSTRRHHCDYWRHKPVHAPPRLHSWPQGVETSLIDSNHSSILVTWLGIRGYNTQSDGHEAVNFALHLPMTCALHCMSTHHRAGHVTPPRLEAPSPIDLVPLCPVNCHSTCILMACWSTEG